LLVVTRLADGAQCVVDAAGCSGDLALAPEQAADAAALLAAGRSTGLAAAAGLFARAYVPAPRLLIVGAVHIAQALAPMAAAAGFEVVVIDPRGAFASPERFPGVQLSDEWPDEALARLGLDAATALVALSHDPKLDDPALELALPSALFYIGALGSRRTHAKRVARLNELGHGAAAIARIHAPVGLDIEAVTAPEIALSVMAEIVAARRGATLGAPRPLPAPAEGRVSIGISA